MQIDFITIDIEGHEYNALKKFDFQKYNPSIVVIEYNDPSLKKIEFYYQNINNVLKSNIFKLMHKNNYHFVNWHHSDLIFVLRMSKEFIIFSSSNLKFTFCNSGIIFLNFLIAFSNS